MINDITAVVFAVPEDRVAFGKTFEGIKVQKQMTGSKLLEVLHRLSVVKRFSVIHPSITVKNVDEKLARIADSRLFDELRDLLFEKAFQLFSESGGSFGLLRQHFLYFFPLPQGQGSFRPTL